MRTQAMPCCRDSNVPLWFLWIRSENNKSADHRGQENGAEEIAPEAKLPMSAHKTDYHAKNN